MKFLRRLWTLPVILVMMAALIAGCAAPTPAAPQIVTQIVNQVVTQIVPQEVTKEVVKEVVVTATTAPKPKGAVTIIRLGTGDSGEGLNPHQEIIANFEKLNPDIIVQLEAVAGSDYYARLLTQVASGDAPDIMQIGDDAVPNFVSKGAVIPLDDFIKGQYPLDTSIYLPGMVEPGKYQGKQYFLPKDFSTLAVYYNKKIFDKYKVPYPKEGWTWEDFQKTAQALTIDENKDGTPEVWGVQLTANWTTGFEYWVAAAGGRLISEDGKKYVGFMDSPETISAVQFYSDLYNKFKVAPPPADFNQWAGGNPEFENGTAAMRLFGRWPQAGLRTNAKIDLGLVGVPVGKVQANVLFWGGFGISSTTKNSEAVWRFLRYYAGAEGSKIWAQHGIPPVAAAAKEVGMYTDPIEGVWIKGLDILKPRAYVYTDFWGSTADPALNKALQTVLTDPAADVAAVMKTAAADAQAALDEKLK
jgi:multiple sugar transport system substrate-binding protein